MNTCQAPVAGAAVSYRDVGRRFGTVRALDGVSLDIRAGHIHALVGENGAGKSTCLGILAGRIAPSNGTVEVFGEELAHYGDPRASRAAGVMAIYQELTIVPALTAEANVFLGTPLHRRGWLSEREMRRRYVELCERVGVRPVAPNTPAGALSVAEQQFLEILRALVVDARVILFDEPTASLALPERDALLALMRGLRDHGITIAFVSHNLDEVLEIADAISVFREGRLTVTEPRAAWTKARLVAEMLGDEAADRLREQLLDTEQGPADRPARRAVAGRPPRLQVEGLTVPGAVVGVDLEVAAGEIVGLGGLVGSGRTTVLRALAGLEPRARGRIWIDGKERPWPRAARRAREYGIALVPEDRKGQGLALQMSAADNVLMSDWPGVSRLGLLSRRRGAERAAAVAREFGFDPGRVGEHARNLSGGNQQKLLLARWRHSRPKVLLADEPTRGIDIGAKDEILQALERMALEGLGLVVVSSELEEVAAISDRVVVLAEGAVASTLDRAKDAISMTSILRAAFHLEDHHAAA